MTTGATLPAAFIPTRFEVETMRLRRAALAVVKPRRRASLLVTTALVPAELAMTTLVA